MLSGPPIATDVLFRPTFVPDWHQKQHIWEVLRSVFSIYSGCQPKILRKLILKSPKCVPFGANLAQCGANSDIPTTSHLVAWTWVTRFGPKICSDWPQSAKMYWNLLWKSPEFFPFGANLNHLGSKSGHPGLNESYLIKLVVHAREWMGARLAASSTKPG